MAPVFAEAAREGSQRVDEAFLRRFADRIMSLPAKEREAALEDLRQCRDEELPTASDRLREFAEEGKEGLLRFAVEGCGVVMHDEFEAVLLHLERNHRAALVAATGWGKSLAMAVWILYHFCCVAQLPARGRDGVRGCIMLLAAPTEDTLKQTLWDRVNDVVNELERRGYDLPPGKNFKSVSWVVAPGWFLSIVRPPQERKLDVAATLRGRHSEHMIVVIDEAMGLVDRPDVFEAFDAGFGGEDNWIAFAMNPDKGGAFGPAYERCRNGTYVNKHLSILDHPNVRGRSMVVPGGATTYSKVEEAIASRCYDRGPYPGTVLDDEHHDFPYALPPGGGRDVSGPREDGVLGSPLGEPRVYRPEPSFVASYLGRFVRDETGLSLFSRRIILSCANRWLGEDDPDRPPDRVGVDPNRGGKDDACHAPAWGPAAPTLLLQVADYEDARLRSDGFVDLDLHPQYVRVGRLRSIPDDLVTGPQVASYLCEVYPDPRTVFVVDTNGIGASVGDHLAFLGRVVASVEGPTAAEDPVRGEELCLDKRSQGYVRAAKLAELGLLDFEPSDLDGMAARPSLAQQLLAVRKDPLRGGHQATRVVSVDGRKVQRQVTRLEAKTKMMKEKLGGRSPDKADALVLAVAWEAWTGGSVGKVTFF